MLNFLHYWFMHELAPLVGLLILLFAVFIPSLAIWDFIVSFKKLREKKELGFGFFIMLFYSVIGFLPLLFVRWILS